MSETDDLIAANQRLYAAFTNRDLEAMDALWASRLPVGCIHPGWMPLTTREAVLASWRSILATPDQPRVVAGGAVVHMLGETALVYCRELVSGSPLIATNVFAREDGEWKLVHHQSGPVAQA